MDEKIAIAAFSALGNELRYGVLQNLVQDGNSGLPAGAIAKQMGISPSALSFHLKMMVDSGLVSNRRLSRNVIYCADVDFISRLRDFLSFHID